MNEYGDVLYEVKDRVGVITLNRPEKLNALSADLTAGMAKALTEAQEDDAVRAVVVTGAGRGFCSGADLAPPSGRTIADAPTTTDDRPPTIASRRYNLRGVQKVGRAVLGLDKPYIAAVNGPAAGAGMDLASMADIRIAAQDARFTQAYTRNAIVPGNGGCYFLPRIVGMAKALELLWTSRTFDAAEALTIGYVSRVVPTESLMEETLAFAQTLVAGPPVAIQYIKQLAYKSQQVDLDTSLRMAQWLQTVATATEDAREGPRAFREKRAPVFEGR
ncbi:MAG TPA: enoyl-CoA hydratase-related protein [Dehalococcoidia bacterium]|jgi:2-(1,2-epoxy-1,2-dihydrophenyl)acetyl-CoA isomerase